MKKKPMKRARSVNRSLLKELRNNEIKIEELYVNCDENAKERETLKYLMHRNIVIRAVLVETLILALDRD